MRTDADRLPSKVTFEAVEGHGLSHIRILTNRCYPGQVEFLAKILPLARAVDTACHPTDKVGL